MLDEMMASQQAAKKSTVAVTATAADLLTLIRELGDELKIRPAALQMLNLDSSFDKDLGLDSLTRMEFLSRIESRFGVTLDEQVYARVETPRDLLREILIATPGAESIAAPTVTPLKLDEIQTVPYRAETLVDVLNWHCARHPDRPHINLYSDTGEGDVITYGQLKQHAEIIAAGLQREGVTSRQAVAIMLPTGKDYFGTFIGVLLAGGVPVPIYPPARLAQIEDHLLRHKNILGNCQAVTLVTYPEAKNVARLMRSHVETLKTVVTPKELATKATQRFLPKISAQDVAFLQYTSGSTGLPKGVVLSHNNLLANIRAMGERIQASSADVFVSWLPLYHDMGLIGAWFGSLYFAMLLVVMPPFSFLAKPSRWLWAIHRYRGTLTAAPNFAYGLCLKRIDSESIDQLDLSSLRATFNGAEPVSPNTLQHFSKRFSRCGLRASAMAPVYGLAEASVGLAFPPPDRGPVIDRIHREEFIKTGRAVLASDSHDSFCFAACGQPLAGHEVRIVDPAGRELPDRQQGRLEFRGPSTTSGYFRNPDKTRELFHGDWLDSGDLAYIADGDIYITSRIKDLIIHGGRNIYPHELEEAVGDIGGIRKGCVAVFGSTDPESGTERLIVLAETREVDPEKKHALRSRINEVSSTLIGSPPDEVELAPPHSVLKTSSGKIRRSASRELFERGLIGKGPRSPVRQFARLIMTAVVPQLRRLKQAASAGLYAGYAWALLIPIALTTWVLVVICPSPSWRWKIVRGLGRLLCFASRTQVTVKGDEHLPAASIPCILVCNHSSYLDSLMLIMALRREYSFVAKQELASQFVAGVFLRRINTQFVERFDLRKGHEDARKIVDAASNGRSILFYPEGTFTRMPGLLPFHMGAFLTASELSLPIVPIVIRGTRSILRADSWFPRHGFTSVTIGTPIEPKKIIRHQGELDPWGLAVELRDAAREQMLRHTHEPDLSYEKSPV